MSERFPSVAELRGEAEKLGIPIDRQVEFISQQQNIYRDERAKDRDAAREQAQAQAAHEQAQAAQAQAAQEQARLDHEYRMAALQQQQQQPQQPQRALADALNRPKLPNYREGEDMSAYLTRFERVAQLL